MRNVITTLLAYALYIVNIPLWGQDNAFIAKYTPDESNIVTITTNQMYTYNFDIDWDNDGIYDDTEVNNTVSHTYADGEDKIIQIRGNFPYLVEGNNIIDVLQWGDNKWKSMHRSFYKSKIVSFSATDVPDLSEVKSMSEMFSHANEFEGGIDLWDVSNVKDMHGMFCEAYSLKHGLEQWDVSNVTNMSYMFSRAMQFEGDISQWDVSNVTNMSYMFNRANYGIYSLGQWDVSNVTDMSGMFYFSGAKNISQWDVSKVTNMESMFNEGCIEDEELSQWDVSNVKNMAWMFSKAHFNGDISQWDVSNVTDMSWMFHKAESFNQDLSQWDVFKVKTMESMFEKASSFDKDINKWKTINVTNMSEMFKGASSFNQDLNQWNVSNVTNMQNMFEGASSFNGNISQWDVSKVNNMAWMFKEASSFDQDLSQWDVTNVTDMRAIFCDATSYNGDISQWDVSNVKYLHQAFLGCTIPEETYDQILINWSMLNVYSNVYFDAGNSICTSPEALEGRRKLVEVFDWIITDATPVGIAEQAHQNPIVYPNPCVQHMDIYLNTVSSCEEVKVINSKGVIEFQEQYPKWNKLSLELPVGLYILQIKTSKGVYTEKVFVK